MRAFRVPSGRVVSDPERTRDQEDAEAKLADHFRTITADFNMWRADTDYAGAMAHHALHHVLDLY
jgi:hypothetical protein